LGGWLSLYLEEKLLIMLVLLYTVMYVQDLVTLRGRSGVYECKVAVLS